MTTIIVNPCGDIIRKSRNLRGILDHARRHPVVGVHSDGRTFENTYSVRVYYANGDIAHTTFADQIVLRRWVSARRSWGLTLVRDEVRKDYTELVWQRT